MIKALEVNGVIDNTLVIVTCERDFLFPRANCVHPFQRTTALGDFGENPFELLIIAVWSELQLQGNRVSIRWLAGSFLGILSGAASACFPFLQMIVFKL